MSLPRRILKGTTYLLTRRCTRRMFLLRPSKETNQIFLYCLAYAAETTGVLLHAFSVLSNHHHIVLTDPEGRLPDFTRCLHQLVSKCINASLGRWENFWEIIQPSQVALEEDEDVLDKIIYTICNPVSSFLVDSSKKWPGLCTTPDDIQKGEFVINKPKAFFALNGKMPENITLRITRPNIMNQLSDEELTALIKSRAEEKEKELRKKAKMNNIHFLGARRVSRQKTFHSPRTIAPRRNLKPRVAAKNKWRRIEALRRLQGWVKAYREALKQWKAGARDVVFPAGTYAMVHHFGVMSQTISLET